MGADARIVVPYRAAYFLMDRPMIQLSLTANIVHFLASGTAKHFLSSGKIFLVHIRIVAYPIVSRDLIHHGISAALRGA